MSLRKLQECDQPATLDGILPFSPAIFIAAMAFKNNLTEKLAEIFHYREQNIEHVETFYHSTSHAIGPATRCDKIGLRV